MGSQRSTVYVVSLALLSVILLARTWTSDANTQRALQNEIRSLRSTLQDCRSQSQKQTRARSAPVSASGGRGGGGGGGGGGSPTSVPDEAEAHLGTALDALRAKYSPALVTRALRPATGGSVEARLRLAMHGALRGAPLRLAVLGGSASAGQHRRRWRWPRA